MSEVSKSSTADADGTKAAVADVMVDSIVRQLAIEAEQGKRKAQNDIEAYTRELDKARSAAVYWQGRADTLALLLERAARPKTTVANAAEEHPALTPSEVASVDAVLSEIRDIPLDDDPRIERDSI